MTARMLSLSEEDRQKLGLLVSCKEKLACWLAAEAYQMKTKQLVADAFVHALAFCHYLS